MKLGDASSSGDLTREGLVLPKVSDRQTQWIDKNQSFTWPKMSSSHGSKDLLRIRCIPRDGRDCGVPQGKAWRKASLYLLLMGKKGLKLTKKKLTGLFLTVTATPVPAECREKNIVLSLEDAVTILNRGRSVGP
jgi:hypothetical protein